MPIEDIQINFSADASPILSMFNKLNESYKNFGDKWKELSGTIIGSTIDMAEKLKSNLDNIYLNKSQFGGLKDITDRYHEFNRRMTSFGRNIGENISLIGQAFADSINTKPIQDLLVDLRLFEDRMKNFSVFTQPALDRLKRWIFDPLKAGMMELIAFLKEGFREMFANFELTSSRIIGAFKSYNFPSFQMGGFIPKEGIYHLHRGEFIVPADESHQTINSSPTINIYTSGGLDINRIKAELDQYYASALSGLSRR